MEPSSEAATADDLEDAESEEAMDTLSSVSQGVSLRTSAMAEETERLT